MATSVCAVSELLTPVTVEYSGPVPSARPAPPAGRGRWFDDAGAISTGSATLQRSLVAALGACGCRPTGRLWRVAELLTRGSAIAGRRCDQRRPGAPGVRAERLGSGRSPRLLAGNAMARAAPPGPRARSACLPGQPDRHAGSRATVSAPAPRPTPNLGTMLPCGWLYARTGIRRSSGEDAPGSGRCLGRSGALCHWMAFPLANY